MNIYEIYEIDNSIKQLLEEVDPETGELVVDTDALDALMMEREKKIENVACHIKNLTASASSMKAEEQAIAKRRQAIERQAENLKGYVRDVLHGEKFQTARCDVSFRKSPPSVEIDDTFIDWAQKSGNDNLLRYKLPEVNKVAVKALLTEGAEIPCARLVTNVSMTIK